MKPSLVWFRSDLRVRDNTSLVEACNAARSEGVIGVFTICPEQWAEHDWAPVKVDFLLRNLQALSEALAELRIPLKIVGVPRFRDVPDALVELAEAHDCRGIYFSREYEWNEAKRDEAVRRRFRERGREVHVCDDSVILWPGAVKTQKDDYYTVFTPFKNRWLEVVEELGEPAVLEAPGRQAELEVEADPVPTEVEGFVGLTRADLYPAGEEAALERLSAFMSERVGDYASGRDFPGQPGTSILSPYLAAGVVSPRQCLAAARTHRGEGRKVWVSELIWREFYRHLLIGFPDLSKGKNFRRKYDALPWDENEAAFEAWCEGRTGYPIVDAGMRQLRDTGWMHNRVRMIVAMFLTKHLLIDWRRGERFFMQHLVDGDLAANNGGWQWSASTGTDAQPYFRVFNPWLQSKRYDPEGDYIREQVPELAGVPAKALHDPAKLKKELGKRELDYPQPIVEHSEARQRAIATFKEV